MCQLYVTLVSLAVFVVPTIIISVCYAIIVTVVCRKAALLQQPIVHWSASNDLQRLSGTSSSSARRYPLRYGLLLLAIKLRTHTGVTHISLQNLSNTETISKPNARPTEHDCLRALGTAQAARLAFPNVPIYLLIKTHMYDLALSLLNRVLLSVILLNI